MKTKHIWLATVAFIVSAGAAAAQMPSPEEAKCGALRGMSIGADQIGLPTSGADIYSRP